MESEQSTYLLYLLVPGKTHHENMAAPANFMQVDVPKPLIHEGEEAHQCFCEATLLLVPPLLDTHFLIIHSIPL